MGQWDKNTKRQWDKGTTGQLNNGTKGTKLQRDYGAMGLKSFMCSVAS